MKHEQDHTFRLSKAPCVTLHKDGEVSIHDNDYKAGCGFSIYMSQEILRELIADIEARVEGVTL